MRGIVIFRRSPRATYTVSHGTLAVDPREAYYASRMNCCVRPVRVNF